MTRFWCFVFLLGQCLNEELSRRNNLIDLPFVPEEFRRQISPRIVDFTQEATKTLKGKILALMNTELTSENEASFTEQKSFKT